MKLKTYCYNVRNRSTGDKMVGGMLHATNDEEAHKLAIKHTGVRLAISGFRHDPKFEWMLKDKKVSLFVYVHPEYHVDDETRRLINALPDYYDDED